MSRLFSSFFEKTAPPLLSLSFRATSRNLSTNYFSRLPRIGNSEMFRFAQHDNRRNSCVRSCVKDNHHRSEHA